MKSMSMKNWVLCGLVLATLTGCHPDLWNQDRYEPLEGGASVFGEGESSSRMPVEGTVPYEGAKLDDALYRGRDSNGDLLTELPEDIKLTRELLMRGQERYGIYCSPCHGDQGAGDGMIVQRGFATPTNFSDPRLLESPVGYYFEVMTNGFGRMYSYASRVPVEDRWAIAAYVRVLQLSQNATPDSLTPELLDKAKRESANSEQDKEEVKGEH
jgi:mono/diheme cytochrome c family protein